MFQFAGMCTDAPLKQTTEGMTTRELSNALKAVLRMLVVARGMGTWESIVTSATKQMRQAQERLLF